ncbi:hypothetical protein OAE71_02070 [Synechococcus sp. AH-551-A21]|nr:hypothetical protein [Synechococcus sp. AH-551-A21]MDB4677927.1 hypothetical protein [Synechococcus sp. AH-551-A21]
MSPLSVFREQVVGVWISSALRFAIGRNTKCLEAWSSKRMTLVIDLFLRA